MDVKTRLELLYNSTVKLGSKQRPDLKLFLSLVCHPPPNINLLLYNHVPLCLAFKVAFRMTYH